ncbi:MAG: RNA polymerase sigma factor [Gemmatales bacterium]|nr:RNA polymerase sigma factor [Gemmatales bacterium]MDW8386969.1 RNA polymerase sigma factor [Gemmatales bacterium]
MTAPDDPDEKLMMRTAQGNHESMEALLRRHATPLLTFLYRLVGNRALAEELFQEAFLAVWAKRSTYRYPKPFKPWLYAIALNKVREYFRRHRLDTISLSEEQAEHLGEHAVKEPDHAAMDAEDAQIIAQAVARLPLQQRTVLVLRIWDGLSYGEIAEVLGKEEATVRSTMHHGLAAIRRILAPRMAT